MKYNNCWICGNDDWEKHEVINYHWYRCNHCGVSSEYIKNEKDYPWRYR